VLPTVLSRIGDLLTVTYAADLLRGVWLDRGRGKTALAVMVGLLAVSGRLTAWRPTAEAA